jgi:hypothetical protein
VADIDDTVGAACRGVGAQTRTPGEEPRRACVALCE